jgi:Ser/Thr protein kinase RdoA (MazF antagonist)
MGDPAGPFLRWANDALRHYELHAPSVRFIGHSENITFQISEPAGGQFLLRLHHPITHTFVGLRQQPDAIRSELRWLEALANETAIHVPQPIRSRDGSLVTMAQVAPDQTCPCTLLRWVEGDPFPQDGGHAVAAATALGRLVAALHQHACGWAAPPDFVRPSYDTRFFRQVADNLQPSVTAGVIEPSTYTVIRQTVEACIATVAELPARATWGIIHNDLHPGNCLVAGGDVRPIDFSLCGWGYFLFDLGTSLGSLDVPLRQACLDGYRVRRDLPENHIRLIEAFFIISRMSSYGFALPNTQQHDWLRQRIPQVVETICQPFLRGETFLFAVR